MHPLAGKQRETPFYMHFKLFQLIYPHKDTYIVIPKIESENIARIVHAREPLYSNSAVIAWCSQSTGAQNILFWLTVIHSMSQYFTAFNFHDVSFIWNYCLDIVVHSGPVTAFKF